MTDNLHFKLIADEDGEYPEYLVTKAILGSALRCAAVDVENNLTKKLPVSATATVKENNILHMTIKAFEFLLKSVSMFCYFPNLKFYIDCNCSYMTLV